MPQHGFALKPDDVITLRSCAAMVVAGSSVPLPAASETPSIVRLGQKLLKSTRDRRVLFAHRSSEAISERALDGDALDRSLMKRIVARDRAAFTVLAERHATIALAVAQRIVRNATDAEDVVQESLTRLWVFADRWNPQAARFSSWFYRIVTNQAISRLRRKTADSIDSIDEPFDTSPGPHAELAGREIGRAIDKAMQRLPGRQRAAIALCYDQGLSCAQAAEVMNVSVGTMESLLFRARRSLREWLAPMAAELGEH